MRKKLVTNSLPLKFMISSATLRMQFWREVLEGLLLSRCSPRMMKRCLQRKRETGGNSILNEDEQTTP